MTGKSFEYLNIMILQTIIPNQYGLEKGDSSNSTSLRKSSNIPINRLQENTQILSISIKPPIEFSLINANIPTFMIVSPNAILPVFCKVMLIKPPSPIKYCR